jgi:hypothetical protein
MSKAEGEGHLLYVGNFLFSLYLVDDQHIGAINLVELWDSHKGMVMGSLTLWHWNQIGPYICVLMNIYKLPGEGSFCDEHGKLKNISLLKTTVSTWLSWQKRYDIDIS